MELMVDQGLVKAIGRVDRVPVPAITSTTESPGDHHVISRTVPALAVSSTTLLYSHFTPPQTLGNLVRHRFVIRPRIGSTLMSQ